MKIKITVSSVVTETGQKITFSTAQDQYVEGANLRFYSGPSSLLVVEQHLGTSGRPVKYFTDFAFSSAVTALDAAATNGQWVLT